MSSESLIPSVEAIGARIAELKRELSELAAQQRLSRKIEQRRNGGDGKVGTEAESGAEKEDGAPPFKTLPVYVAGGPSTGSTGSSS